MLHPATRIAILAGATLVAWGGCAALFSARSISDIQSSEFRASLSSDESAPATHACIAQALYDYRDGTSRPFADLATRVFGTTHEIAVKTPHVPAAGIYDTGGEYLVLIETKPQAHGSVAALWVNQYLLVPNSNDYLTQVLAVTQQCPLVSDLTRVIRPAPISPPGVASY